MKNIIKELRRKDHLHVLGALTFSNILDRDYRYCGFYRPKLKECNLPRGRNMATLCFGGDTINPIMFIALQHNGPSWHCNLGQA